VEIRSPAVAKLSSSLRRTSNRKSTARLLMYGSIGFPSEAESWDVLVDVELQETKGEARFLDGDVET
jgi:hypothetical protein